MAKTRGNAESKRRETDAWAELRARCRNHWREILVKLGIPSSFLSKRDCPCPMCGGTDRFRFSDRDGEGTWFCRACGGKDGTGGGGGGFVLAMKFRNTNAIETRELIEAIVGAAAPREPPKPKQAFAGPVSMPDPCERFESDAWAGLPLTSRRMLDVIETAWFRDSGRSAWLVVTVNQFEARGVDRTAVKRARKDLLKRGLIDHRSGGKDPATKHQEPSVWRLTYAPMGGVEPSDKWRTYQASKAGGQKCHSGGQNGSKAPFDDFSNDFSTVSMSDNTGNATFGEGGSKVPLGPGVKSATVKSQRLVESIRQKQSQSQSSPVYSNLAPVSAVDADPMSSIHGDPMSVDPMSVGKPDHTSADVDPKSQIYSADPFADGPPPPPAMTGRLGTTASAHESAETAAAPSGRSNRAPEARKPSTATPATPALTLPASSGFKACRYGCHGGCTEPDGVCVKMKQSWIRGEKSARRGDTPDNGKDRATWAKSSS